MIIKRSLHVLALTLFPALVFSQTTITGTVTQAKTGEPLAGVHVYLAQTTIGSTTDPNGYYSFSTDVEGIYELVFSFVGFKKKVITVNLDPLKKNITHSAELTPDVFDLPEVEVVTSNKEWKSNLDLFREQFIGTYGFADQTEMVNPWVIDFVTNKQSELVATTLKPLIIENHALGYRLHIELGEFRWETSGSNGYFTVFPRFEEMQTADKGLIKEWEKNREKAYEGSFQHFLKSLYDEHLSREQFSLSQPAYLLQLDENEAKYQLLDRKGVSESLQKSIKGFKLQKQIDVFYGQKSGYETVKYGTSFNVTRSFLVPNTPQGIFFVDELGNLLEPTSLQVGGEWARHRMSHRLPLDYTMKN